MYRSRALERIPDPKPLLSQTGSPLMPGPVPSVSTKTRGYTKPPVFHTERNEYPIVPPIDASYSSNHTSIRQHTLPAAQHVPNSYVPSYQKKVPTTHRPTQRPQQQFTTITRTTQPYRPSSVQPTGVVHRQYNSPMGLYSRDNIQEAMNNQVSHVTRVK